MVKPSGQLCGDFQLGGYLSIHTTAIWRPPKHLSTSDRPEKTAQEKQTSESLAMACTWIVSLLVQQLIGGEKCALSLGAN